MERSKISEEDLIKAGIEFAKSPPSPRVEELVHVNRTIWNSVPVTNAEMQPMYHDNGKLMVTNQPYVIRGQWVSREMYQKALEVEQKFKTLNELMAKEIERRGLSWKVSKPDIIAIEGVTL